MRSWLPALTRFLRAEEIPRWFGLSIVLIYLIGMATAANVGIGHERANGRAYFRQSMQYALGNLADRLAVTAQRYDDPTRCSSEYQRSLRQFALHLPARFLRVVADGHVIASTNTAEIGADAASTETLPRGSNRTWTVRLPLRAKFNQVTGTHGPSADTLGPEEGGAGTAQLVAVLPFDPPTEGGMGAYAGVLATILVVLGALFVTYRCVRQQLRNVSRIANRLETYRNHLTEDLTALRIADSIDEVVEAWNALIELAQELRVAADQSEANAELSRALQSAGNDSLSEALNAVPDGIMHIKGEERFAFLNAAAARILGWSREQCKANALSTCSAEGPGQRIIEVIRESLRSDGMFESSTAIIEPDTNASHDETTYRVWVLPPPRGHAEGECVVIVRDVTQQLRADRAREEFVAQVTHELRTPLTNIRAYAETLSSGMFDDPKVVTECYNVITKETRRLSRLVEDILSVSQLEVGSMELTVNQVDLRVALEDGVRDVAGLADEKNIDLQIVLPSKLEPIQADRDKLAVVVNNLLGNAIKYTANDGIIIVGCKQTDTEAVLTIKDNGIGIDPADHARIFERFQRGSNDQALAQTGTGIGLYTAQEIVRRHGGEIELISEEGNGSTFMVKLPHTRQRATTAVSTSE